MVDSAIVAANFAHIRERIRLAGGSDAVAILAVTKNFPIEAIHAAASAGCTAIGENYAQELGDKAAGIAALADGIRPEVHFIGHLQSNKIRQLAKVVDVWQSLDRPSVIDEVARRAAGARVFLQVNVTGEAQKSGCEPTVVKDLARRTIDRGLRLEGLMTLGALGDRDKSSAGFDALTDLADDLGLRHRSMGMSDDLELAVAAGSTMVRIGTALFGPRR